MLKLQNKLKTLIWCLAAIFCIGLGADDIKIAVLEPTGKREVRAHFSLARNAFINTISKARGFQVMDRARTDQILNEHSFQRNTGLLASSEARELGKMLGVDLLFVSELGKHEDSLEISCQVLDIVTGQVVGSESTLMEEITSKLISENCQDLAEGLLKSINRNLPSGLNRAPSGGAAGAAGGANAMLSGLDAEISRLIMNNRTNAKWNRNRANYMLEVDLAGVSLSENRQFGTPVYRVSGTVAILLTDAESGGGSSMEVELQEFTEMTRDLIRNKIRSQVQPKVINIIRELLSGLDGE